MRWKEISSCVSVAVALMCLITIIPVHAAEQHDWAVTQAFGQGNCMLCSEVDGWWDPNDRVQVYYKTEFIAVRVPRSPWVSYGFLWIYWYNDNNPGADATTGDVLDDYIFTPNGTRTAKTRCIGSFRNPQTGATQGFSTPWATISNSG